MNDFDDLDSLLSDSVRLAHAKRDKAQGRKLKPDQQASLDLARAMEEINAWEPIRAVVYFQSTTCTCGNSWKEYQGTYLHSQHRRTKADRLTRKSVDAGLPEHEYWTHRVTLGCAECVGAQVRSAISVSDLPILSSLSDPHDIQVLQANKLEMTKPVPVARDIEVAPKVPSTEWLDMPLELRGYPEQDGKSDESEPTLKSIIMKRDALTSEEADELIAEARERVADGEDPEIILREDFDLEPDYIWELI